MLRLGSRGNRRRRRDAVEPVDTETEFEPEAGPFIPDGPYDAAEEPDDDVRRLDLGALRVPMFPGMWIQLEETAGRPPAVLVMDGTSRMELSVFAAPKSNGLWDDMRTEILDSLHTGGGFGEVGRGRYGPEILMRLPTGNPRETMAGRIIGVDGPRWVLQAVITGKAGADPGAGPLLDEVLRSLVVVRGEEAMPVRDALPLHLPKEMTERPGEPAEPAAPEELGSPVPPAAASQRMRMRAPARGGARMSQPR
jgi:hypothetical protein